MNVSPDTLERINERYIDRVNRLDAEYDHLKREPGTSDTSFWQVSQSLLTPMVSTQGTMEEGRTSWGKNREVYLKNRRVLSQYLQVIESFPEIRRDEFSCPQRPFSGLYAANLVRKVLRQ